MGVKKGGSVAGSVRKEEDDVMDKKSFSGRGIPPRKSSCSGIHSSGEGTFVFAISVYWTGRGVNITRELGCSSWAACAGR